MHGTAFGYSVRRIALSFALSDLRAKAAGTQRALGLLLHAAIPSVTY